MLDCVRRASLTEETVCTLKERVINVSVADKFCELQKTGVTPVCLFPTRKACNDLNMEMLKRLASKVHDLPCSDEIDETAGMHKWTKKATEQLEKLNHDCSRTAGLEAKLTLAVGARVMLRRNIDTNIGLVNGAIGTVLSIACTHIQVQFDHISQPHKIEKVKTKFIVMKNFYVYREQFRLILAYAVTIHKCQGLSLDCAILDLSNRVFSAGMAYVALSRVRSLSGVFLSEFDPKSVMVSLRSLKEVNRLREAYRKDLPLYDVSPKPRSLTKRKLTGTIDANAPKRSKNQPNIPTIKPKQNATKSSRQKGKKPTHYIVNQTRKAPTSTTTKRKQPSTSNPPPPSKKHCPDPKSGNSTLTLTFQTYNPSLCQMVHRTLPGNLYGILNRLRSALCSGDSTIHGFFDQYCNTLDSLGDAINNFPIPSLQALPHLQRDRTVESSCHPLLLHTVQPVITRGDGSCLYNVISLCLTGSKQHSVLLRLLCAYALYKYKGIMLQTIINAWYSTCDDPIVRAEEKFYTVLRATLTPSEWGGEEQLFALSYLFNRPIFQYNTFYLDSVLTLADTRDPLHLAQRFLNYEPDTRHHLVYCNRTTASILEVGSVSTLPHSPLAIYNITDYHWVALIYHSQAVVPQIPIPRTRILRDM